VVGGKEVEGRMLVSLLNGCFEAMSAFVRNYLQGFLCFRRFENQMFEVGWFFGTTSSE